MRVSAWVLAAVLLGALAGFSLGALPRGSLRAFIWVAAAAGSALCAVHAVRHLRDPLRSLSNLILALRSGDYAVQARAETGIVDLDVALRELNALADTLREQRTRELQATELMRQVLEEMHAAVFVFERVETRLKFVNRGGEALTRTHREQVLGRTAAELGMAELVSGPTPRNLTQVAGVDAGVWELQHAEFREHGRDHLLVILNDVRKSLREEERRAQSKLVRVLSHEVNNSLSPIQSLAQTLSMLLKHSVVEEPTRSTINEGLSVIERRASTLGRFMAGYAALARVPEPVLRAVALPAIIQRVAALDWGVPVEVGGGGDCTVLLDEALFEQALINLVKNAVEATRDAGGSGVRVEYGHSRASVWVNIEDQGHGIANPESLFVPHYTTKKGGQGIGLCLSREIIEAHRGSLELKSRLSTRGAVAELRVPLANPG